MAGPAAASAPAGAADGAGLWMFLLAGQSNMAGRGPLGEPCPSQSAPPDPRILSLDSSAAWVVARHPLHDDKPDRVGVGPGLAFAQAVVDFLPAGSRVGLLPCAFGGSEIERWRPPGDRPAGDLFRAAAAAVQRGRAAGGVLRGVLWHQGESDAGSREDADRYPERLRALLAGLRAELGADVPLILGELGLGFLDLEGAMYAGSPSFRHSEQVNTAILEVAATSGPLTASVSAAGLDHKGDRLHFTATAADELGRRYAWRWLQLAGLAHGSLRALLGDALDPAPDAPALKRRRVEEAAAGSQGAAPGEVQW